MSVHDLLSFVLEFDRSTIIESYGYAQYLFDSGFEGAAGLPDLSTSLIGLFLVVALAPGLVGALVTVCVLSP